MDPQEIAGLFNKVQWTEGEDLAQNESLPRFSNGNKSENMKIGGKIKDQEIKPAKQCIELNLREQ